MQIYQCLPAFQPHCRPDYTRPPLPAISAPKRIRSKSRNQLLFLSHPAARAPAISGSLREVQTTGPARTTEGRTEGVATGATRAQWAEIFYKSCISRRNIVLVVENNLVVSELIFSLEAFELMKVICIIENLFRDKNARSSNICDS